MNVKALFASLVLLALTGSLTQAQLPQLNKNAVTSAVKPGQLLTQFTNALKPTAFTSAFAGAKEGIVSKAQKASSALDIASTVSSLAGYIKPDMFKQGSTAKSIMDLAGKAKTMAEAGSLLKSFEGSLKPEAFTSNWSNVRPGWLSALNQLK